MSELRITPWRIESRDANDRSYRESIFSQGNGYMGTRGYRPDERGDHPAWRSTFLAGFYEYVRPRITDIVNQPDFSGIQFSLNGTDSEKHAVSDFVQALDMKQNLVTWEYSLTDDAGHQTKVKQEKILSMADRHVAAIRISLTPLNWSGVVKITGGIDASVENLPIADDQLTENVEFIRMWGNAQTKAIPAGGSLETETTVSHRKIAMAYVISGEGTYETCVDDMSITTTVEANAQQGKTITIEKRVAVASFRDGDAEEIVGGKIAKLEDSCFDQLLAESAESWSKIWDDVDVEITGNEEWQGAIRYNIMQLVQTMPYGDPHASIGARGLTHGRYKGCYFWDTEIFMLPFFAHTQPDAAKTLLEYRYNILPDAIASAKGFSTKGARYSWMSSDTGFEQCESWDTGCCEIHITADIAHAITQYWEQTGDDAFLRDCGAEMLIQTARYWVDRFTYSPAEDCYHLLFVKGPDEYCGVTVDDFYTVSLAKDNLEISALGQGVKSSVFLLIYYNFFNSYPKSLDEAAKIDGAGPVKVFFKIALPMVKPALVLTYLFSFIWIWNDTTQLPQYSTGAVTTLPMHLQQFVDQFNKLYSSAGVSTGGALNESIRLAGTLLTILPLIILYFIVQKQFIESIERTGLTGE